MRTATALTAAWMILSTGDVWAQRGSPGGAAASLNGWHFSFSEGKRRASEANKPIMLVFRCDP